MHYGSLPAFSIYGCWEIAGDEFPDGVSTWPFSLVAESTAEVYVIQKQEKFWAFSGTIWGGRCFFLMGMVEMLEFWGEFVAGFF